MENAKSRVKEHGLRFAVSDDDGHLYAKFNPIRKPLDTQTLRQLIELAGYGEYALNEDALVRLVSRYNAAEKGGIMQIGERRDGQAELEVTSDSMTAYLYLEPPQGGRAVSKEAIMAKLKDKGIRLGVMEAAVEAAAAKGQAEGVVVAMGKPPVHGEDAKFVSVLPEVKERRPRIDEAGEVDYRDLGSLQIVHPGDELMRRVPATNGEPGKNLFGHPVRQTKGKDILYSSRITGVRRDYEDPNILRAKITGQPVVVEAGMCVEPTITVANVDLSTGNIDFEGAVNVEGDVRPGMKVVATGDIYVGGLVEACELRAGGDIVVTGGIIGHGDLYDDKGHINHKAAFIYAKGSVSAYFIENARVETEQDVLVGELVSHSELSARQRVVVGRKGAKRGHIIGGRVQANQAIRAQNLGSPAGVSTHVHVGEDIKPLEKEYEEALERYNSLRVKRDKVMAAIKSYHRSQTTADEAVQRQLMEKAQAELQRIDPDFHRMEDELEALRLRLDQANRIQIIADKKVYSNVSVHLRDRCKATSDERGAGVFFLDNGEIAFGWSRSKSGD